MDFDRWRHYARAWLYHFFGNEEAASAEYEEAFRIDANDAQSARHLAAIAAGKRRFDVAERWFAEVLRIAPESADDHFNLGFVRGEMGKSRDAIASFQEAVRYRPSLDRAWYGMGLAHIKLSEHELAITPLDRAAKLQPMNGHAWHQLGIACHLAGKSDRLPPIVKRIAEFDPKIARQLIRDTGRDDLTGLLPELPEWATR